MAFTEFWAAVTVLGDIRLWIIVLFFSAMYIYTAGRHQSSFYLKRKGIFKKWLWVAFLALVITGLASQALKVTIAAPRICDPALNPYCPADSFAFPSGHAAMAFAMFAAVPFVTRRKKDWAVLALPLLVSYSRLVLQVHTMADVIGGTVLGIVSALIALELYEYGKGRKDARK